MTAPPRNDAAPRGGGAGVAAPNTSPDSTLSPSPPAPCRPDPLAHQPLVLTYALAAIIRFDAARALARELGPSLWPDGPARSVAAAIVEGRPWRPAAVGPAFKREAIALIHAIERAALPTDEAHAMYLVRLMAEERHGAVLAATLRWAAAAVEARRPPLGWVGARVAEAFAVAAGDRPLNPAATWAGSEEAAA